MMATITKGKHVHLERTNEGRIFKRLLLLPETHGMLSIKPAANLVEFGYYIPDGTLLIIQTWRFDTRKEATEFYDKRLPMTEKS